MSNSLEILSASVTAPAEDKEASIAETYVRYFTVSIDVANRSPDTTYHVWTNPRRIDYDASTRTLSLALAEVSGEQPPDIIVISQHPRTPSQIILSPGEQTTLRIQVPSVMKQSRTGTVGLGLQVDDVEVGPVEHVSCTIAYADVPFRARASLEPKRIIEEFRLQASIAQATVDVDTQGGPSTSSTSRRRRR